MSPSNEGDLSKAKEELSKLLGQEVSESVLIAALEDPTYAHNLVACRNTPEYLEVLLKKGEAKPCRSVHSNGKLIGKATKAVLKWAASGFAIVDDEIYERRLAACKACPHFVEAPRKTAYLIAGATGQAGLICKLCGCIASRKARLPSESCPAQHPDYPELTRWSEPRKI